MPEAHDPISNRHRNKPRTLADQTATQLRHATSDYPGQIS
jgi:hypothetical protein